MSLTFGLGFDYTHANDYLAEAQAVPQNTTAAGNGGAKYVAGIQAAAEILAIANEAVVIAAGKNFTIKIQDCETALGTFADLTTIFSLASPASETTYAAGYEFKTGEERYALPTDAKDYVKASIVTTDAAADGKLDIVLHYIPR
jgi:hypothetical protein